MKTTKVKKSRFNTATKTNGQTTITTDDQLQECIGHIKASHEAVEFHQKAVTKHGKESIKAALECGRYLQQAKTIVGHGTFMAWCDKHFPKLDHKTLTNYMSLHTNWEDLPKVDKDACETLNQAYLLAKVTTPQKRVTVKYPPPGTEDLIHKGRVGVAPSNVVKETTSNGKIQATTYTTIEPTKTELTEDEQASELANTTSPVILAKALEYQLTCCMSEDDTEGINEVCSAVKPIYTWYLENYFKRLDDAFKPTGEKGNKPTKTKKSKSNGNRLNKVAKSNVSIALKENEPAKALAE
jgi:hypothetical protein